MEDKEVIEAAIRIDNEVLHTTWGISNPSLDLNQGFSRPILLVKEDMFVYKNLEKNKMVENMLPYAQTIKSAICASGIIKVKFPLKPIDAYRYPGTAFLVDKDIIVTNRHVAESFAEKSGGKFVFKKDSVGRRMSAVIDFKKEYRGIDKIQFDILKVLHIEESNGPDIAFLQINNESFTGDKNISPVKISSIPVQQNDYICAIGYHQEDKKYPDQDIMRRMLEKIYNVKRVSPGIVKHVETDRFIHDCSTLGGSSGSMIFNYKKGEVIGIHFGWSENYTSNYAIPSSIIAKKLKEAKKRLIA